MGLAPFQEETRELMLWLSGTVLDCEAWCSIPRVDVVGQIKKWRKENEEVDAEERIEGNFSFLSPISSLYHVRTLRSREQLSILVLHH